MHIYHHHARNKDTQPATSGVPPSHSSTSLSSSFSSAASSVLLPAAPASNSSQSDLGVSDLSATSLPTSHKSRFFPLSLSSASPHLALPPSMGQSYSRDAVPASPTSSSGAGSRLKRAWAGRRKKSEDITATFAGIEKRSPKGKEREREAAPSVATGPSTSDHSLPRPVDPSRGPTAPKNMGIQIASTKLNVFGGKKSGQSPKSPEFSGSPPPLPPKFASAQVQPTPTTPTATLHPRSAEQPVVNVALNPAVPSSVPTRSDGEGVTTAIGKQSAVQDKERIKEDWRKSDSTMTSHVTIRPGALGGSRSPRPVSLAESSHSGNTIVPINKRLSALITDAEFATLEESDSSESDPEPHARLAVSGRPSPSGSMKAKNRRSASLSLGPTFTYKSQTSVTEFPARPPSSAGHHSQGRFLSDSMVMPGSPLSTARDTPTLTRAAASGIIAPTTAAGAPHTTGSNIRSRLAAWTAVSSASSSPAQPTRELPSVPPPSYRPVPSSHPPSATPPSLRQTAVSISGGLAPAAGFAMGFGKRAVEKVGRAWGGLSSSSSSASGYSSSSSVGTGAASLSSRSDHGHGLGLRRTSSNQTNQSNVPTPSFGGRRTKKRTPGNASIASSITSSSASDIDQFVVSGPSLGTRLRGPRSTSAGASIAGGLVFRRELKTGVRDTAIDTMLFRISQGVCDEAGGKIKTLEERMLPALVVRCAQHLLRWGVEEEGLFRVSGRSSHVAKLRSEFDAGADFNMVESDPGDLDPHAVASIFKTYLRELPESILTATLIPYFESALAEEEKARQSLESAATPKAPAASPTANPQTGLPRGIRKPPSLSTLAMPTFTDKRTMSDAMLNALTWLVAQLPRENRDLLYTVVELIKATAANSKETKMPLGNLLLVFCPSLNMNPALLRVLCEAEGIWDGIPQPTPSAQVESVNAEEEVIEINAEAVALPEDELLQEVPTTTSPQDQVTEDEGTQAIPPEIVFHESVVDDPGDARLYEEPKESGLQDLVQSSIRPPSPVSCKDVTVTFVSAQDIRPARSPSPAIPDLSSSAESLSSPSTISEEPASPEPAASVPTILGKATTGSQESLVFPEPDWSLLTTPQIPELAPIPFPSSGDAHTLPTATRRKSFAMLSFPPLRSEPATSSASVSPMWSRPKRPSLHLLLSKKSFSALTPSGTSAKATASTPSLGSPYIQRTPVSSPQISVPGPPPKLSTTISLSPIGLGFDDTTTQFRGRSETVNSAPALFPSSGDLAPPPMQARTDSSTPSIYTTPLGATPQHTPIADLYQSRSQSVMSLREDAEAPAPDRARKASQVSLTPSLDVGVEDAHDDWAQSVLDATHGGSDVPPESLEA